jgi:hypothetical protein
MPAWGLMSHGIGCPVPHPADAAVDAAARVLLMLYSHDLQRLQSAVDEAIVSVQVKGRGRGRWWDRISFRS